MIALEKPPIPGPWPVSFRDRIRHPDLWLWDSWLLRGDRQLDLFCLALSRRDRRGRAIRPDDRNRYQFHVRRFSSSDHAQSWQDKGCVATPGAMGDGSDSGNIWSGSALMLPDGRAIFAYTGIRVESAQRPFVQSLNIRVTRWPEIQSSVSESVISCSRRDRREIVDSGYYLGPIKSLGDEGGEEGGPILCWRDPFLFEDHDGRMLVFVAAKLAPSIPAIATVVLKCCEDKWLAEEILPPMLLPDRHEFTQAELPKIYCDSEAGRYLLLISSTNRKSECQPDSEIVKEHRLYIADSISGPWASYSERGSSVPGLDGLFGGSFIDPRPKSGCLDMLSPYSELAPASVRLTMGVRKSVRIFDAE